MSDPALEEPVHEPCAGCGALMDVTTFSPFDTVVCPSCSAETNVKKDFGTYQLRQRFAIGGMSVIFEGWDTTLDRRVAIKVLNEEYCNDEIRIQSFENEARLTAQVSHPNVVKVYAVGRAYGRFYLVMELIKGKSFEGIINKRGAIPESEVLDISLQVAAGLRAAKNAGMIHRDVKPGNILIDEAGHARLLDFGLALITQDGRAQADEVWATPYYVPPEALERGIEDFRSDIYAFGASLYHALAGKPPIESTTNSNNLLRRAKQTIPRLCKVAPWVSPATGEAIDRMMAFNPEHRWASYAQVIKSLENAKKNVGKKSATPIHSQNRLKRRKQKSHFGLVFAFLLVALCVGLVLLKPWEKSASQTSSGTPPVEGPAVDLNEDLFNPGGDPDDELFVLWDNARALVKQQKYDDAVRAFEILSEEPTLAGMPQIWSSLEAGVVSALNGQPGKAREFYSSSLADLEQVISKRSIHKNYRPIAESLGRIPPPHPDLLPENPKGVLELMTSFALALKQWEQGQWSEALPTFAKVRGADLPDELDWFSIYQNITDIYLADGLILSKVKELPIPANAEEAGRQIETIAKEAGLLKTKGRAPFNLEVLKSDLSKLQKRFGEKPSLPVKATWDAHRVALLRSGRNLRFDDLAALLENPPSDAPEGTIKAWRYLTKNAMGFTRDLASTDDWTVRRKDGLEVMPVSGNLDGLRVADGSLISWNQFSPDSLLKEHAGEDRHAVAFAWLVGMTNKAEELAEELAKYDDDFRRDWREVILGLNP